MMHEVIRLGLIDRDFIAARTSNYDELARTVADYPPERAAQITGIDAEADPRGRAGVGRGEAGSSTGAWASPSTPPAPTTPAA